MSIAYACHALSLPRSVYYYHIGGYGKRQQKSVNHSSSTWALSESEREHVLSYLHSPEFIDRSPNQVYATLLDMGIYVCSIRTMYRILNRHNQVKERRRQSRHVHYSKPELLATAPNQVWSWDITKLKGPVKWTYYYLYVILDIFSRYVTGWMLAEKESADLARTLITETCLKQNIIADRLTIHSDRGPSMISKSVALLLAELGINKSHSRPYVSDDNPYSESQFKTLKYSPGFPDRFGSKEEAHWFLKHFFQYYNCEHKHSGLRLLSPAAVHYEQADKIIEKRNLVLSKAYSQHPERFRNGIPKIKKIKNEVWINQPKSLL